MTDRQTATTPASRRGWSRMWAALVDADALTLVGRLTIVATLVNARGSIPMTVVAVVAGLYLFLEPARMARAWPWLAQAGAFGAIQLRDWWVHDDHVVATTYWLLALGLSRLATDTDEARRQAARLLIGTIFAFAFGWKLVSSQYVSNDFWRYQIIWDDRFEVVANASGLDDGELEQARARLVEAAAEGDLDHVVIDEGRHGEAMALAFTVWGLLIEAVVAAVHLLPRWSRWERWGALSVFVFCATTYLVVPVAGFGALLLALVAASSSSGPIRGASVLGTVVLLTWGFLFPVLVV